MRTLFLLALWFCGTPRSPAADYLFVDAKINDQPVRLTFDTGAEYTILFERTAQRLHLKVTGPPPDPKPQSGRVPVGVSEPCRFTLGNAAATCHLAIFKLPDYIHPQSDGILAWSGVRGGIIRLSAATGKVAPIPRLPDGLDQWLKWSIVPDLRCLTVRIPGAYDPNETIFIDTGNPSGVDLNASRWRDWCNKHEKRRTTLAAAYSPAVGLKVYEQSWASRLTFGRCSITHVPVILADSVFERMFANYQATLGLFALTRFEVIIDGPHGLFYTRPIENPPMNYKYNRLGAVFVPEDHPSGLLTARVLPDSPAHRAGVRPGDLLLKIDDLDITRWRTDPRVLPLSRFWEKPAGSQLVLSLARDGQPLNITVELRDIFPH